MEQEPSVAGGRAVMPAVSRTHMKTSHDSGKGKGKLPCPGERQQCSSSGIRTGSLKSPHQRRGAQGPANTEARTEPPQSGQQALCNRQQHLSPGDGQEHGERCLWGAGMGEKPTAAGEPDPEHKPFSKPAPRFEAGGEPKVSRTTTKLKLSPAPKWG